MDDFASTLEREACEARSLLNRLADMLVSESQKDLKRNGLAEHATANDSEEVQTNLMKSQNLVQQFGFASGSCPCPRREPGVVHRATVSSRPTSGVRPSARAAFDFADLLQPVEQLVFVADRHRRRRHLVETLGGQSEHGGRGSHEDHPRVQDALLAASLRMRRTTVRIEAGHTIARKSGSFTARFHSLVRSFSTFKRVFGWTNRCTSS